MGALILRIRKLPIHFVAAKQLADTFRTRTRGGPDFEIQEKNSGFIISTMGYRLLDSPEAPGSLKVKKIRLYTQGLMTPRCRPARKIVHMYEDTSGCSNLIGWGCAAAEWTSPNKLGPTKCFCKDEGPGQYNYEKYQNVTWLKEDLLPYRVGSQSSLRPAPERCTTPDTFP